MCSCENEGLSQRERVAYRVRWRAALQARPYAILRRCALGAPAQIFPIFRSKTVRRSCVASKKPIPNSVAVRAIAWHANPLFQNTWAITSNWGFGTVMKAHLTSADSPVRTAMCKLAGRM
jgi:hypothetical protein